MNFNNKTLNGLIEIDSNSIYSDYYEDVAGNQLTYLSNVRSDIQQQIDSLTLSGNYNNSYLQSEINSISGILNNYIIYNNNINTYQNLYLSSLSSSIVAINNINNYQNLYLYSISSYILAYNNNQNIINTNQNLINISISNYINYNNLYLVTLSNSINTINNYLYNSISGYLYYYNQTVNNANLSYGYMNQSLGYKNNCYDFTNSCYSYTNSCNDYKNQANDAKNQANDARDSANASATASGVSAGLSAASSTASATSAISSANSASQAAAYVASFNTTYGPRIEAVETKTQYESVILGSTNFNSPVTVSNPTIKINLNNDGSRSVFYDGIDCQSNSVFNGVTINNSLVVNSGGIISDSVSIDSGKLSMKKTTIDQIAYNSITTGPRDCAIEFNSNYNPLLLNDTGTINMRAFNVNIGNPDQSSVVYINGTVYFSNPLNMSNFINQFA